LPLEIDERFIEIDFGVLEGVALRDVDPSTWDKLRTDVQFAPEQGESFAAVAERVGGAMEELLPQCREGQVVVVSHVLPIKAAVAWALDAGIETAWRLHLDQASITRIDAGDAGPLVRTYNEIAHLGDGPG
jgi:broad specificity phosphatase PhoE